MTRRSTTTVTLGLKIRSQAHHVAYYVDAEIVDSTPAADDTRPTAAVLPLPDAVEAVLCLLTLAGRLIPDAMTDEIGVPPTRYDALTVWLMAGDQDLYRVLGFDNYRHDLTNHRAAAGQFTAVRGDAGSDRAATLAWLEKILLDDGVHEAEGIAAHLLEAIADINE